MQLSLDVPLRGQRDYLQGGDILRSVSEQLEQRHAADSITRLRTKFNNLSHTQLALSYWPAGEQDVPAKTNGLLWFELTGGKKFTGYLQETHEPIHRRIDGFESEVVAATTLTDRIACTEPVPGADLIEQIVFATKLLHNTVMPVVSGRWIVVEFMLDRFLGREAWGPIRINLEDERGGRITQSRITVAGDDVGQLRFLHLA